jgi:cyanophycinase
MIRPVCLGIVALAMALGAFAQEKPAYQYFRLGSAQDVLAKTTPGYALMGGGTDLDEAFRWLCARAAGGDFLVLRAAGTDAYNPYIAGLEDEKSCKLNSVATLVIPSREAAAEPFVAKAIRHAEAIFIAGGDQANYVRFWTGTPVQQEINAAIARGVPLGGTSAGLAVMGEWAYSAEGDKPDDPNLDSATALRDPMGPRVTLVHGFLEIPVLKGIITDSHFAKRDRMGRLLVFLADVNSPEQKKKFGGRQTRGLGIDQETSVLLCPSGAAEVVGKGSAYLVEPAKSLTSSAAGVALDSGPFLVQRIRSGERFDLFHVGEMGDFLQLTVANGVVSSSPAGVSPYGRDAAQ